mgnify:CR=1 FL=1
MSWTLQFGGFWPERPVKNPIQMWRASKGALKKACADLDEKTIHNCGANAHKRLEAVVEAEGGYIEKKIGFL